MVTAGGVVVLSIQELFIIRILVDLRWIIPTIFIGRIPIAL